jgi:hypothetical protein
MDKETKILKSIMNRFKGLIPFKSTLIDDADTAIENLLTDIGDDNISYGDIEDYIHKVLG